jgi:hypothetical protein
MTSVEVALALDALLDEGHEDDDLDWRRSVVDLLKLLNLDSTIAGRAELARELGLPDGWGPDATSNTKLHDAVVKAVAEHRIELPHG